MLFAYEHWHAKFSFPNLKIAGVSVPVSVLDISCEHGYNVWAAPSMCRLTAIYDRVECHRIHTPALVQNSNIKEDVYVR